MKSDLALAACVGELFAVPCQLNEDGIEALEHVGVTHAHDANPHRWKVVVTLLVLGAAPVVHRTVHLDRQPELGAREVHDGSGENVLPSELPPAKASIAQRCP